MRQQIPFTVSARTARLIGSENFSNPEGAVIELVKNSYDADASCCIVLHDGRFSSVLNKLTESEYKTLKDIPRINELYKYDKSLDSYMLSDSISSDNMEYLKKEVSKFNCIYIIDNGCGMDKETIVSSWMIIGTEYKKENLYSDDGRIRTGAKGIGRFALDRLGEFADIVSCKENAGIIWSVNWKDFENANTINDVQATLDSYDSLSLSEYVHKLVNSIGVKINGNFSFKSGTVIKISGLRDNWDQEFLKKLNSSLELLTPPFRMSAFQISLYTTTYPLDFGEISVGEFKDYDYKLSTSVSDDGSLNLSIDYNEFDYERMPKELSTLIRNAVKELDTENKNITIFNLNPGIRDKKEIVQKIKDLGAFKVELYFLKQSFNNVDDSKMYYKSFSAKDRKDWLSSFAGIRIFRDNFRVRPYGEVNGSSFDWLDLGARVARSPAGIGRGKGYKMGPRNLAGSVEISRLYNDTLQDTSNREGIQETPLFIFFKDTLLRILSKMEKDRAFLTKILLDYDREKNASNVTQDNVNKIISILSRKEGSSEGAKKIKEYISQQDEQIKELISLQKMLRILASGATTISAFAHELENIRVNLVKRVDDADFYFKKHLSPSTINVNPALNPYNILNDIKHNEIKLKEWLGYALGTLRKDKRKRSKHNFVDYLNSLNSNWAQTFKSANVLMRITPKVMPSAYLRIFEVDLDCIFNNLISNSLEAFQHSPRDRVIDIKLVDVNEEFSIIYSDNGVGLSKDILDPNVIFEPFFTTRKDANGKEVGTGLGMWLLKTFMEDNKGTFSLLNPSLGFSIKLNFPKQKNE